MSSGTNLKVSEKYVIDGVMDEDRDLVRDVLCVLSGLELCSSWSVTPLDKCYEIHAIIDCSKKDMDIEMKDLELIQSVDPHRIQYLALRCNSARQQLIARILKKSEPIFVEERDIIRIKKRRTFLGSLGLS